MAVLIVLSVLNLIGAIVLIVWTIRGMQADIAVTGTYLFPVWKWCSARHLAKALAAGLALAAALFGALLAFKLPAIDVGVLISMGVPPLLILGVVAFDWFWQHKEADWVPLVVTATRNMHCTACGGPVPKSRKLGGWCAVCGAGPDEECNAKKHIRHNQTGDSRSAKEIRRDAKKKGAKRR